MKGMRKRHRKRLTAVVTAVALICTGGVLPENMAYAAEQTEEGVAIDKENFPDENLRNYLKESGFDKNDDGYFSQSELDAVEEMEAIYNKLENLKGLEYFRNLKSLDIRLNNISGELDLQLFPNLTSVYCDDNEITSIRFGENCKLELIGCNYNQIEVLDVSGLDHLDQLVCTGNPLKVLKFNEKWTSIRLYCDECSLTSLKIPESLDASETQINCENNVTYLTQKNIDFLDPEMFPDFDTGKIQKVVKLTKEQEEAGKSGTDIFDELKGSDYKLTDLQLGDRIIYTYDCGIGMSFDFTVYVGYSEEMFPPNRPDGTQYVEYTVSTVGEVPLPEGWKWKDEDADLVLPFGNWYEATAEYVGDNAEYYANIYQDVEIWKDYCQHPNDMRELKDEQEADCTQNGYTGDYYCGVCGDLLYKGEYIPKQHRLELVEEKEATQTEPGNRQYFICSACGKLFLDEDGYHEVGIEDVTIPVLEPDPTDEPVPAPSEEPTAEPTEEPKPTEAPLPTPGVSETPVPTEEPTPAPSEKPTAEPTREPEITPEPTTAPAPSEEPTTTPMPSEEPTMAPSEEPTMAPMPSEDPTMEPTTEPTEEPKPTEAPRPTPGVSETPVPTEEPTPVPTEEPTTMPSEEPTMAPAPTEAPTAEPTREPEITPNPVDPTVAPAPTEAPTMEPTREPAKTAAPIEPTKEPVPTDAPVPTEVPTQKPEVPEITPEPTVPAVPTVVPPVRTPVPTQTVQATQTPATPAPTPVSTPKTNRKKPAKVGKIITSSAGDRFKVTSSKVKNPEVALYRPGSGRKEVKIGTKVTINGISYSVTSVCERAFRSNKRVTKVSLGSRVDKIGKEAFANCRNIKVLYIYSPRLKASDIGENAFKGINKRVKISVPKAKMKEYKELFREKGLSKQTSVTTGKVQ
ncbi:MAG: leucine-rich repeat protein [Roseburia sp.]|nr:leucine-rich repeat protein [Roseburia sp.]